jgi:hypothetical protein
VAKPPKYREMTVDVPEEAEWLNPGLVQLASFMADVQFALNQGLVEAENSSVQFKTLEFATPDLPITFRCTLPRPPKQVEICQKTALSTSGTFTGATECLDWTYDTGNLRITTVTGLTNGQKYRLVLKIS